MILNDETSKPNTNLFTIQIPCITDTTSLLSVIASDDYQCPMLWNDLKFRAVSMCETAWEKHLGLKVDYHHSSF